jgi:DNA-binding NarL/FixJ family response regulator
VRLEIALHTVKSHVHRLLSKLEVNSRLEVVAFARHVPVTATSPA